MQLLLSRPSWRFLSRLTVTSSGRPESTAVQFPVYQWGVCGLVLCFIMYELLPSMASRTRRDFRMQQLNLCNILHFFFFFFTWCLLQFLTIKTQSCCTSASRRPTFSGHRCLWYIQSNLLVFALMCESPSSPRGWLRLINNNSSWLGGNNSPKPKTSRDERREEETAPSNVVECSDVV